MIRRSERQSRPKEKLISRFKTGRRTSGRSLSWLYRLARLEILVIQDRACGKAEGKGAARVGAQSDSKAGTWCRRFGCAR